MGVSRSRDDYRLGEPVIQDMYPLPPGSYFFFAFLPLDVDRDGGTFVGVVLGTCDDSPRNEGSALLRRNDRWVPTPMRLRQDVSNFAPTIYIAFFSFEHLAIFPR